MAKRIRLNEEQFNRIKFHETFDKEKLQDILDKNNAGSLIGTSILGSPHGVKNPQLLIIGDDNIVFATIGDNGDELEPYKVTAIYKHFN